MEKNFCRPFSHKGFAKKMDFYQFNFTLMETYLVLCLWVFGCAAGISSSRPFKLPSCGTAELLQRLDCVLNVKQTLLPPAFSTNRLIHVTYCLSSGVDYSICSIFFFYSLCNTYQQWTVYQYTMYSLKLKWCCNVNAFKQYSD